jgi:hypothetical protein
MSETKNIRLTKKGLPDKRAESSKKNLEKGKSVIKHALKKLKEEPKATTNAIVDNPYYSSDDYSTDEEEIELKIKEIPTETVMKSQGGEGGFRPSETVIEEVKPIQPVIQTRNPDVDDYKFTFEKKLEDIVNKYNLLETDSKLTKEEMKHIKAQNQVLKKQLTNNFRTHAGTLNQEMFLKF